MSSLFGKSHPTPKEPKPLGMSALRTSSHERAKALPYFCGLMRMPINWLDECWDQKTVEIHDSQSGKGGGKAGNSTVSGYDYYASLAGAFCLGAVDQIKEIWFDDEKVWDGTVSRFGDSTTITIEDRGNMQIYWGTATQSIDSLLGPRGHPAYRGICYAVFDQLYFGRDRTNAPNVEVVLYRAPVAPGLTTSPVIGGADANPIHFAVEMMTAWYGMAIPNAYLDLAQLDAAAVQCAADNIGLSPFITEQMDTKTFLQKVCEYIDAVPNFRNANLLQLVPMRNPPADVSTLPTLGEYDLTELPKLLSTAWNESKNEFWVSFTNRDQYFYTDSEIWRDLANLAIVGEPITEQKDMPWITYRDLALRYASNYGRLNSVPSLKGTLVVRKSSLYGLGGLQKFAPGNFIRLTYQDYGFDLVMRVTAMRWPEDRAQTVEIDVFTDQYGDAITEYTPEAIPENESNEIDVVPATLLRIIEVPAALRGNRLPNHPHVLPLLARPNQYSTLYRVYSSERGGPYRKVGQNTVFCRVGTLAADYLTNGFSVDPGATGMVLNIAGTDTDFLSTTDNGYERGDLLIFLDDEILTYETATYITPSQVRLTNIARGQYDTLMANHYAGATAYIVQSELVHTISHRTYAVGDTISFKIAPSTGKYQVPLNEVTPIVITLTGKSIAPRSPTNLLANGVGIAPTYSSGSNVVISWQPTDFFRPEFWQCWDEHIQLRTIYRVAIYDNTFSHLKRRSRTPIYSGSWTYTSAQRLADFGGSEPRSFGVRVVARLRGVPSNQYLQMTVTNV